MLYSICERVLAAKKGLVLSLFNIYFKQTAFSTDTVQAPTITCPSDMDNIPKEPGQSYAIVKWQLPVPSTNSNETLELSGLRSPQKRDVGKTHISYEVTDSSGLSSSCTFFINVKGSHCFDLNVIKSWKFKHYSKTHLINTVMNGPWEFGCLDGVAVLKKKGQTSRLV